MVNQAVTMSIDPSTLKCMACSNEHPVLDGSGKPIVIFLADQNFVPMWEGQYENCGIVIIRVFNPTLQELLELLLEVLDRKSLPEGSLILAGSVSYLFRVGTSLYTREWTRVVARATSRWQNIRVPPLIPLIREDVPGGCLGS